MSPDIPENAETVPVTDKQRAVLEDIIKFYFDEYDPLEPSEVATLNRNKHTLKESEELCVTPEETKLLLRLMGEFARSLKVELEEAKPEDRELIFGFFEPIFQDLREALENAHI